jgi:hypothetical protein
LFHGRASSGHPTATFGTVPKRAGALFWRQAGLTAGVVGRSRQAEARRLRFRHARADSRLR